MSRIYKGAEVTLNLYLPIKEEGEVSDLKIALYTDDPNKAVEFFDTDVTLSGCDVYTLKAERWTFMNMNDGVVRYISTGYVGDNKFIMDRQSNYFLKTPITYTPDEALKVGELKENMSDETITVYAADRGYDGFNVVNISAKPYGDDRYSTGHVEGYTEGHTEGYGEGYTSGYDVGYDVGTVDTKDNINNILITI